MASIKHLTETHAVLAALISIVLGTAGCGFGRQKQQLQELPSPSYAMDVQYFEPDPEFKAAREREKLRKANRGTTSTVLDADESTAKAQANSGG